MKNILESKAFKIAATMIGGLIIFLLILNLGIMIGYRKAAHSDRFAENYFRNFEKGGRDFRGRMPMMDDFDFDRRFMSPGGAAGQIIQIKDKTIIVRDRDGLEKAVIADDKTVIRLFRDDIKFESLKIDDEVVVFGAPDEKGQIVAKLIRVMPGKPFGDITK